MRSAHSGARCRCSSGLTYDECCGPIISGQRVAPTARALMQSRFTAFAIGDDEHLLASWHPRTRPVGVDLDPTLTWYLLEIEFVSGGTPFDSRGQVEFIAHYRSPSGPGSLHERSEFEKVDGAWYYVTGAVRVR